MLTEVNQTLHVDWERSNSKSNLELTVIVTVINIIIIALQTNPSVLCLPQKILHGAGADPFSYTLVVNHWIHSPHTSLLTGITLNPKLKLPQPFGFVCHCSFHSHIFSHVIVASMCRRS